MQYDVTFADTVPSFEAVQAVLAERDITLQMRMIDGQLAAPTELPPENWQEIRVAIARNMLTVRRGRQSVSVVAWGNADGEMADAWHAITWGFAAAGNGSIGTEAGPQSPDQFSSSHPF